MGGQKSENYEKFRQKCVQTFIYLRKYSKLIINLFHVMLDSGLKVLLHSIQNTNCNTFRIWMRKVWKGYTKNSKQTKVMKWQRRSSST